MGFNYHEITTDMTKQLCRYIKELKFEDIPPFVIERTKMCVMQTIGVSLCSTQLQQIKDVIDIAKIMSAGSGEGGATLWGDGAKVSWEAATLAAGTLADALDWEDCSWTGHPAAGVIPCAWIAAEEKHKSGKDLLTAIVAGYEVYQRIAMAVHPDDQRWKNKGWGLTSWQIFAAIIPAAKLYGFDARKINQAIGMGCENSTLPTSYHAATMSDFYHYEHGYRARDGFLIVNAVDKGIHNMRDALDEPRCYTGAICDQPRLEWFNKELGQTWLTMETLMKHWPANMWVQTPVEIIHDLVTEHSIQPDDIREIVVDPPIKNRMWAPDEGFSSVTHAQFSMPFVTASMLYDPHPGAHWYAPEKLSDPKLLAMAKRVKPGPSREDSPMKGFSMFQQGQFPRKTVTITLNDGTTYTGSMDCHPGHPKNMMSREEFVERFRIQAAPVLQGEKLEKAIEVLCNIENVDDIASVCDLLL